MAEQLTFDWPTGVALGDADFFVSEANAAAYAMVTAPAAWPEGKLILTGPTGSGKSHLARVFAAQTDATVTLISALTDAMPKGPTVIEDADQITPAQEEALFHLHNNAAAAGHPLLLTAQSAPGRWPIALPDLASRMQATTVTPIAPPDDALLQALLMKLFADRQLMPAPAVLQYLTTRMERSYSGAATLVAQLDQAALAAKSPITRKLAGVVLDNLAGSGR